MIPARRLPVVALFAASITLSAHVGYSQSKPVLVGQIKDFATPSQPRAYSVAVSGRYVWIGSDYGLYAYDVTDTSSPRFVGKETSPTNGSAPQRIVISGPLAYLAHLGLRIVDISDPSMPKSIGFIDQGNAGTNGLGMDLVLSGHYVYLANGADGLRVYDVSDPRNPTNIGHWPNPNSAFGNFPMGIAMAGSYLYLATFNDGLRIFDVTDPATPQLLDFIPDPNAIRLERYGNRLYLLSDKLKIFDLADPAHPAPLEEVDDLPNPAAVAVDGNYAYVANSGFTTFGPYMFDVSNPTNAVRIAPKSDAPTGFTVWDMALGGNRAYLVINDGLAIYDLGTPTPPSLRMSITADRTVTLSWPAPSFAFLVQATDDLSNNTWFTVTNAPASTTNGFNQAYLRGGKGNGFYRLLRPE